MARPIEIGKIRTKLTMQGSILNRVKNLVPLVKVMKHLISNENRR